MSPARTAALRWIAANEPIGMWPIKGRDAWPADGACTPQMAKRLIAEGALEVVPEDRGRFSLIHYRLSATGRAAATFTPALQSGGTSQS